MKIDPDEKYVLIFPKIRHQTTMEKIATNLKEFLAESEDNLAFIYGEGVAIVPAKQIVGYKVIARQEEREK